MHYTWVSRALDLTQMVMDIQKQLKLTYSIIPNKFCLKKHFQKVIPWDTPGSMPYIWVLEAVDLTQMVMDIQKQLEITIFIIPNNFCFNNVTKKSVPGRAQVQCPTPGCPRLWTSPRWSWTSVNTVK